MALIGTISGSVGTGGSLVSATAISGTLVVADSPASVFPTLPTDVKFFVSGVQGAIVASLPGVAVFGGDLRVSGSSYFTDIDVTGHGAVIVQPYGTSAGQTGEVRFKELAANGGNYTALKAADGISADLVLTLPAADGADGNILKTSGTGVTSFVDASSVVTGALSLVSINASGDITGSNALLNGDLAVNGGDITTTAGTFNLVNAGATTINFGGAATTMNVGSAGVGSIVSFQRDIDIGASGKARFGTAQALTMLHNGNAALTNTAGTFLMQQQTLNNRIELQTTGSTSTGMFRVRNLAGAAGTRDLLEVRNDGTILIGSATLTSTGLGSTTISNDLFLSTGILAVNTDATDIQLISSGNVTVKLDANNNAAGHFFAIRDFNNINQFRVTETGNADIQGNLTITGSVLATTTTTTFNLLNTALTGTLNIGGAATNVFLGSLTSTGTMVGDFGVNGRSGLGGIVERMTNTNGGTGTVNFDLVQQSIFYVNGPTANITANFTSVPTTTNRVITPTVILSQSAAPTTARIVSAVQIDGAVQTINWANGVTPSGNQGKQDVFGFSLIRSGTGGGISWKVLGQMSTYG